jgi:hypothetical protein
MPQHWAGQRSDPSPSLPSPTTGGARGPGPVPGVDGRPPQFALTVPAHREGGTVGATKRDGPGSLEALDDGSIPTRIRACKCFESLRGRRSGEVDVLLDRERDAVKRREIATTDNCTVSGFGGFEGLLA